MMGICDDDFSITKNIQKILNDILFEYEKNNFIAIYLDFHSDPQSEFVSRLDEICERQGIKFFVPMNYAKVVKYATIVIDMAISGGNVKEILQYNIQEYGVSRIATQISHIAKEFYIPYNDSIGMDIVLPVNTDGREVFFSDSLCTNYFTYMKDEKSCIFTIFDNEKSFFSKLEIIKNANIKDIFAKYEHIVNDKKYNIFLS